MASASNIDAKVRGLREQINLAEQDLASLRQELKHAEQEADSNSTLDTARGGPRKRPSDLEEPHYGAPANVQSSRWPLPLEDYKRYGRQMITAEVGLEGQLRLHKASVLIVGLGGLGCPAASYLAGAGVGTLGFVDGDTVEVSNLHRQILHRTKNLGMYKVDSATQSLRELNPTISYVPYRKHLSPEDALDIFSDYDIVLDCTDHPTSRYLISDACVLLHKVLVSASALRAEGQLMVLNHPPRSHGDSGGGPCYRCIFPKPPPADSVTSCGEGGILGPVVGTMGVLQALEAVKVICSGSLSRIANGDNAAPTDPAKSSPSLLLFSAYSNPPFQSVRLRPRRPNCAACSASPSVTRESLNSGSFDYVQFCGVTSPVRLLANDERILPTEYARLLQDNKRDHVLVDVREKAQFGICNLPGSVNVPFSTVHARSLAEEGEQTSSENATLDWLKTLEPDTAIFVVCRLGNDSQVVVRRLKDAGLDRNGSRTIEDIRGGYQAWKEEVDHDWPEY